MRSLMKMQRWGFSMSLMISIPFVSVAFGCSPPLYPNRGGGEGIQSDEVHLYPVGCVEVR